MSGEIQNLLQQAKEALDAKKVSDAEAFQRQACELLRVHESDASKIAVEIEALADIHCTQRKFDQSALEYAEVLQMREKFLPENDLQILRPLYRMAKSNFEGQRYEAAEAEMRRALSLAESRDDSAVSVAFCLYELGWLLYFTGMYREAEPFFLKALPICEKVYGDSHSQTLQVLGGLALLYQNCTDLEHDPEPYFRRAIEASKSGTDLRWFHRTNLLRLAKFLDEHGRVDEADEVFSQLLAFITEEIKEGGESDSWAITACVEYFTKRGKSDLVADLDSNAEAAHDAYGDTIHKRLEHAERTLSQDDPELASALLAVGNHETYKGRYDRAEPLLVRAAETYLRIYGEKDSQTIFALTRVCIIKRLLRKFDEAEMVIQKALRGAKENFPDDVLYPWTLKTLALLREVEGRTEEAMASFAQAVSEYERIRGLVSYETAEALYQQSGSLLRMDRLEPAEKAIRLAISVMDQVEELSGPEKSDYLTTLAAILEATDRGTEAAELRTRAQQLFEEVRLD
jgi:tetratricopeptide (TPR) repeat protein